MNRFCSLSHACWLRCLLISISCAIVAGFSLPVTRAQNLEKPLQSIEKDITAFAYAPDGRIVYSVNQKFKTKLYELEHDDIWLQDANGKSRRILVGEKFNRGNLPFSYIVNSFRWSPNGKLVLAELLTTTVDDSGKTTDSYMTLVLDDSGKEIRIAGGDSVIPDAANPFVLPDNASIVYLSETTKPRMLFSFKATNRTTGVLTSPPFDGRTFRDVSWLPASSIAIGVEQDHSMTGPQRLQHLDLSTDNDTELATLDGYAGGLSVSPSGKLAAYFIDKEILEIRDLTAPTKIARLRVGLGTFRWTPNESRIFLKRSIEKKSGDIIAFDVPPLTTPQPKTEISIVQPTNPPFLHGVSFRDLAISPDGRFIALIAPGTRNLQIFPLK